MPKKKTSSRNSSSASSSTDFEKAMNELEKLVEKMEKGDLSLEDSLKTFERGIELTRTCQQALRHAEQKVQQLLTSEGKELLAPFDED